MNYLNHYRVKKLLTQRALAKISGITQVTISFIENDHTKKPQDLTKERLARALDVSVDKLFPPTEIRRTER